MLRNRTEPSYKFRITVETITSTGTSLLGTERLICIHLRLWNDIPPMLRQIQPFPSPQINRLPPTSDQLVETGDLRLALLQQLFQDLVESEKGSHGEPGRQEDLRVDLRWCPQILQDRSLGGFKGYHSKKKVPLCCNGLHNI